MSLFTELKRRNVFKGSVLYLVTSWVILQVAELLLDALGLSEQWLRLILVLLVLGFPLLLVFSWVYEITPEGIKREKDIAPGESTNILTGMRINLMILVLMAIAVGLQVMDHLNTTTSTQGQSAAVTATAQPDFQSSSPDIHFNPTDETPTIAVLPFANMSDEPKQEYFADGVAEEILNSLSRISHLQVRGRTSSFYFKGRNEDLKTIAAQLNVDHILEGSVRKFKDRVRITVQLIDVSTDTHLWSKTYDRVLDDIFTIQDDIAASVSSTLQISLGVGELGSEPGMTRNVRAYDLLLEARKQFGYGDRSHYLRANELLEQAVEIDPEFALGWAVLANAYSTTGRFIIPDQAALYQQRADAALSRAEQLAPDLWSVLLFHAETLQAQYRWQQAEEIIQRLTTTRSLFPIDNAAGFFEADVGHIRAALVSFEKAASAEPLNQSPVVLTGGMYAILGDYVAARASKEKAKSLPVGNPSFVAATELMLAMAQHDSVAVKRALEEYLRQSVNSVIGRMAMEFYSAMAPLMDSPNAALESLRRFAADPKYQNPLLRSNSIAIWAAYFGDPQLALDLQYIGGKPAVLRGLVLWQPVFADMRHLYRFKQLVIDLGLVDYWRATGKWGDFCKPVGENDFECH